MRLASRSFFASPARLWLSATSVRAVSLPMTLVSFALCVSLCSSPMPATCSWTELRMAVQALTFFWSPSMAPTAVCSS